MIKTNSLTNYTTSMDTTWTSTLSWISLVELVFKSIATGTALSGYRTFAFIN